MIIGAHFVLSSRDADADRAFLREIVELAGVDAGAGWWIFGLPPAELAVHPSGRNDVHEFYLMCDDIDEFMTAMQRRGVSCTAVRRPAWGVLTYLRLPGGGRLGVYQPRHSRPSARKRNPRAKRG